MGLCDAAEPIDVGCHMGKKTGWEDSSKQPDWIDIASMCQAMSDLHGCQVGVTILPGGRGFGIGVSVAASAMFDVLPEAKTPECVAVVKDWPCTSHATLSAHVFSLLYELDYKISSVYNQTKLWN